MLTKFLSRVSIFCAWLVVILAILGAALFPIMIAGLAHMEKEHDSVWTLIPESALLLVVALGGYLLIRHKPWGLLLVALPAIQLFIEENILAALVYLATELLIFGTPLALANFSQRSGSDSE